MEPVVQQVAWRDEFEVSDLEAAAWRLSDAKQRINSGEPTDSFDL